MADDSRNPDRSVSGGPGVSATDSGSGEEVASARVGANSTTPSDAFRDALMVLGFGFLFWLVLALPAWLLAGTTGLVGLSISGGLCLVPGCLAAAAKTWWGLSHVAFFLVASGLRLFLAAGGALVAKTARPELGLREFFVWLILFYLCVVAVESLVTLKRMGQLKWLNRSGSRPGGQC